MQLDGATELERRIYDTCLRVERELPASELATAMAMALSEAGQELQRLRRIEAAARAVLELVSDSYGEGGRHATMVDEDALEALMEALGE